MINIIILLLCLSASFFSARATAKNCKLQLEKSGFDLSKACWAVSKMLGLIVICGFIAAFFSYGHIAHTIFLLSIAATIAGGGVGSK